MPENYILLERTELNATAASVTFANIPQTGYTDLKIVASVRSTTTNETLLYRLNGTTTGYTGKYLGGTGSATESANLTTLTAGAGGTWGRAANAGVNGSSTTASTFSSWEMYIPNYTSANNKSVSFDSVTENNATTAYAELDALLWSDTAAITTVAFAVNGSGSFVAGSTFSLYGIAALGTTPVIAPKASGGNVIATDGTYWYHAFTASGTFTPQTGLTADVLVVAGGGGGGCWNGGGGGAGGLLYFSGQSVSTSKSITIGAGGAGSTANAVKGTSGTSSIFEGLTTAVGGGGGGTNSNEAGLSGGSGGGSVGGFAAGTQTSGQGFAGSVGGTGAPFIGGGGGGAGEAGGTDDTGFGGDGINTYSSWLSATSLGVSGFIAGGGAGGFYDFTARKTGGDGGGGDGGTRTPATKDGVNATASTGSGGGAGGYGTPTGGEGFGGNGAGGIILIRYPA
jgi:hypothetical protein